MKTIKAKVHMLPTKEITNVLVNTYIDPEKHSQSPVLDIQGRNKVYLESKGEVKTIESRGFKFQHLYITTDEEIKEGDWYLSDNLMVLKADKLILGLVYAKGDHGRQVRHCRKIIATTDPELISDGVAEIEQSFIEDYCKAGGIDEVLVEYIGVTGVCNCKELGFLEIGHSIDCDTRTPQYYIPNLKDNTIIIHIVEEKMYSREEVRQAILNYGYTVTGEGDIERNLDKWIEENL